MPQKVDVFDLGPGTQMLENGPVQSRPNWANELDPQLELIARWMDSVFEIPGLGIRFGFDAIVGLIPGIGDMLTSLVSLYILRAGHRYGLPRVTLMRMALNIAVDTIFGSIPILGDAFDVYWKANLMNVALIRRHVASSHPTIRRRGTLSDWLFVGGLFVALLAAIVISGSLIYLLVAGLWHFLSRGGG